jgi:hypothetical protein
MSRRVQRPTFSSTDKPRLLDALREARHWTTRCAAGQDFHSDTRKKCDALLDAIDDIAEEFTGDRTHFHLKMHST